MATVTPVRPEGVIKNWDLRTITVKELEDECAVAIGYIRKTGDDVASTDLLSYDTVLKPILECIRLFGDEYSIFGSVLSAGMLISESEEIRSVCTKLRGLISDEFVALDMRKDVYDKLVAYERQLNNAADDTTISDESRRCLRKLILNGRRNGLEMNNEIQLKVKAIKKEISDLSLDFMKNYSEADTFLLFEEEELKGMDSDFLKDLEKEPDSGKLTVTLKTPDYVPLMKKCTVPATRRRLEIAYHSQCTPQNAEIIKKLVHLRAENARTLGYSSHAAYVQEVLMAKNPTNVESFLQKLIPQVTNTFHAEKVRMLELKEIECNELGIEFDGKLNMWDISRYFHLMTEKKYSLDADLLKQYFPMKVVVDGMLQIYQQLLGLTFTTIPDAEVWSSEVTVYQVDDTATGETLGYFYLDLYPRQGKFGHACCGVLQQGCLDDSGKRLKSVAVLVCNFPKPTDDNPSLLSHDEVETMFHEFGHGMHIICSKAETPLFHGYLVERDFLEAPSQMLENWCYKKESLQLMSKHHQTGSPLPDEMIDNLVKSKAKEGGGIILRQILYALTDLRLHTENHPIDSFEPFDIFKGTLKELMDLDTSPGTNDLASFWHLGGGYDAAYYGYMWSEVYGQDMFDSVFEKDGVLNPVAGKRYRECILEPGGSVDGMEMLLKFLGREPSMTPFLKSKGII